MKDIFDRDDIQFPRLLDEVSAVITPEQKVLISYSTGLTLCDIDQLFERASETFDAIKMQFDSAFECCVYCGTKLDMSIPVVGGDKDAKKG